MASLRIPRSLKIIAIIYLSYLALMTLVAMPLLNVMAPKIYREQTGRELHLQKIILLNPFTLSVTVRGATSDNPNHSRFWALDRLTVNLSLASIWQRHVVLDELALQGLNVQVEQSAPDRFNFSDILEFRAAQAAKHPSAEKSPEQNSSVAISIHKLEFSAQHLGLHAPYLSEPIAANIDDFRLTLDGLSTISDSDAKTPTAITLHSGAFATDIKTIELKLLREQHPFATQLRDLHIQLDNFSSSAIKAQPFAISVRDGSDGSVQINGDVSVASKTSSGTAQLRKLDLLPAWHYLANKLAFDARSAQLDGDIKYSIAWNGPLHYRLSDSRVNLHDVQLQARTDTDTHLNFNALQVEGIQVDSAQPRAQIAQVTLDKPSIAGWNRDTQVSLLDMLAFPKSDEPSTSPPWQIQIDNIAANDGDIRWHASQIDDLPLQIAPLQLHISNVRWPDAAPLHLELKSEINNEAQLALNGDFVPSDMNGKFNTTINGVPLAWGNSLLKQQMQATLASGRLNAQAEIALAGGKPTTVHSEGHIDQLELQQLPDQRKLLAWKQLQWHGLTLDLGKQTMQMRAVDITEPWAQFRINQGGTNNFQELMGTANKTPATTAEKKNSTTKSKTLPAKSGKAWQFAVDTIHVDKALIDFRDNSMARSFHTTLAQLTGNIDGLSNHSKQPAKINMKGTVDGYAPVALTGTANPFTSPPGMNVALDITNLDLATLTPYSGTYAGYLIDGGRLTVQLAYTLENNRIKGTNHIVVNEMKLGDQVTGPKVMDLPLRFAIYLLTDANGVMDLGVDVTGNVDDPNFSVGSIIWKAFRNLIVKTATSPFRALARMVGGSENDDLDRVNFAAGSDRIDDEHNDKLTKLVAALQKKSALNLSITGHVSPSQDLEALRDLMLSRELIKDSGITQQDIQTQSPNWQRAVAKLFKKHYPQQKADALQPMQMNDWMRDNNELQPSALQELASSRALAVKQLLVTKFGLEANRASVKPVDLGADDKPGLQVTMDVN